MKTSKQDWPALVLFLGLSFGAAFIGSLFTSTSVDGWYRTLPKPAWTPPGWTFGPVWTLLYLAMALAAWLVWRQRASSNVSVALSLFIAQLVLNAAWSAVFFGLQNPGLAFANIVLLWSAIAATMIAFWRITATAGWLFVPYILWVTFATALNFAIWRLNS
jgi:tryptophan-rich sensory protein